MKWCDLLFFSAGAGLAAVLWWMRGCPLDSLLILALLATRPQAAAAYATSSGALVLAVGAVASILASRHFKRSSLILMLIIIPMWMNFLLRTYAWINLLDTNGLIAKLLGLVGLGNVSLLYNTTAVIIGLVYNFLPFMILPIYTILSKMQPQLIEAAEDLGANSFQVFRKVKLPLSMPGIVSGITMVFIPATTTFAVSRLLGGGQVMMYGELIENQFLFTRNWHFGAALSLVMMVLVLISMWLFRRHDGSSAEGGLLL